MKGKNNKHNCTLANIKRAIQNIEKQPKRQLKSNFCNIAEMEKQKEELINAISQKITETENHNTFNVYSNEAGFGKTRIGLNALVYFIKNNMKSRCLWVAEETSGCDYGSKYLNSIFEKDVAIAIHSKNDMSKEQIIKALDQYVFVFITHERYKRLSLDQTEKELYIKGRDLLVIDEYIDTTQNVDLENDYTEKNINKKGGIILDMNRLNYLERQTINLFGVKSPAMECFNSITRKLYYFIEKYECKLPTLVKITKTTVKQLDTMLSKLNNNMEFVSISGTIPKKYEQYKQSIIELKNFYLGYFLIEKDNQTKERTLKVPNYYIDMWGLKRNIILDASANLCYEYKLNPTMYNIIQEPPIFNYKNWHVCWINVNTTQHGKCTYKSYYEPINKVIEKMGVDKTLIVTTKYNDTEPSNKNDPNSKPRKKNVFLGTVTHWGDFKGKNDYENLQNIIIEDSNWLWSSEYILKYLYYARNCENITQNIKYIMVQNKFENELLQEIAESITANNYYQAVKRINRHMEHNAYVSILCANKSIVDKVVNMLPDCNYCSAKDTSSMFEKKESNRKPKKKQNINRCIKLCNMILQERNNNK